MPNESDNRMNIGKALLTKIGQELAPICGSRPVPGFLDLTKKKWMELKYLKSDAADTSTPGASPTAPH
jgi:formate dehydrogenase maturation protein FdhE